MTEVLPPEDGSGLSMRTVMHIVYGLFALGVITSGFLGFAVIFAVVLAYLKRGDFAGTVYASHIDWILKTFWWGLLWLVLSLIGTLFYLGWIALVILGVWLAYRLIRGWLALFAGEPAQADA